MRTNRFIGVASSMILVLCCTLVVTAGMARADVIFTEDFDSLPLQDQCSSCGSGETPGTAVWTDVPPAGWSIDNSQMGTGGVPEFYGWVFLDLVWWNATAGQNRNLFDGNVTPGDAQAIFDNWLKGTPLNCP